MRTILRYFLWTIAILAVVAGGLAWWFVYRRLPQIDGTVTVAGLKHDVTVERDKWGVPHIRAESLEDAVEAEGYVMAQDRLWQLDLMRRAARGELSEIVGPLALRSDRQFRTYGFGRAAERDYAAMDKDAQTLMAAYARGVNRFIELHRKNLPMEFSLLKYEPSPWQPTDSLVVAGYMYQTLTNTWERELDRAKVEERAGPERSKDLFSDESPMDHFVVGDSNASNDGSKASRLVPGRKHEEDEDASDDTILKAESERQAKRGGEEESADLTSALWPAIQNYLEAAQSEIRAGLGSNDWVVSGAHTESGKPILANDTHLELSVPPIWYEIELSCPGYRAEGFTLPGAPLIVIGHNDHIAWGFTNNGADVQDLYTETFNPEAPDEYRVNGAWEKAQTFDEVIHVKGQADEHWKVVVTRHGPIVRREGGKAYALKWTALEPGGLGNTYNWLSTARNWEEFKDVMKKVWGPGQNAVYADVDGNIGYVMAARVPIRKKGNGEVPVPGDTDDYEWTGYIPFDQLPQALNPQSGLIVTANARVVGPEYKPYLTDRWEEPYRTARIYSLLHNKNGLRPIDMLRVETDTYSYPHMFLAEQMVASSKSAQPRDARARELIEQLKNWNGIAEADSPVVSFLEMTRRAALRLILEPYLGSDTPLYEWRSTTFLQKVLTNRSAEWLPGAYKSYDELLAAAADEAVEMLVEQTKSKRISGWKWEYLDSLDMLHPLGRQGILKWFLSISGKPQSGTAYSVRAATTHHGPSMRFIANTADWDASILLIPAGESGQLGSGHYTDQFSYWYEGRPIQLAYSDAAEANARQHTLTLKPAE
ncbi:MAG TPA: penicillin acylase family protein [Candidatus Acidoferrum sp.]|nr:penicillin acylase family protein [Candidatus Acidoferrum sp.]